MAAEIQRDMDYDDWQAAWFAKARERGHVLKTYDDEADRVDLFVTSRGWCNGPGCVKCGWTGCMHCDWTADSIPECTAR